MNTEHVREEPGVDGCICPQDFTRPDCPTCRSGPTVMSPGEAYDAACRENELAAMAEAGQKLAVQWGHEPWSDSWARLVAETLDRAARNANHWRCADCNCLNRVVDWCCYLCGAGQPENDDA